MEITCVRGDLTHDQQFEEVISQIRSQTDTVDIIVHSAASGVHRPVQELSLKHLRWTFELNVFAIHKLVTEMIDRIPEGGRLIGITSAGSTRVIPYYAAVGATKGALEALFRHYAQEFAPRGVSVNCVCPGLVLTDAVDSFPDRERRIDRTRELTPIGRLTEPEDVADVISFLCQPEAQKIVGQTIVVDGGKALLS
jgi:enoyl-[acyl-carrier protein] reductase III